MSSRVNYLFPVTDWNALARRPKIDLDSVDFIGFIESKLGIDSSSESRKPCKTSSSPPRYWSITAYKFIVLSFSVDRSNLSRLFLSTLSLIVCQTRPVFYSRLFSSKFSESLLSTTGFCAFISFFPKTFCFKRLRASLTLSSTVESAYSDAFAPLG